MEKIPHSWRALWAKHPVFYSLYFGLGTLALLYAAHLHIPAFLAWASDTYVVAEAASQSPFPLWVSFAIVSAAVAFFLIPRS